MPNQDIGVYVSAHLAAMALHGAAELFSGTLYGLGWLLSTLPGAARGCQNVYVCILADLFCQGADGTLQDGLFRSLEAPREQVKL